MENKPMISIIIPVYNVEKYLKELEQEYKKEEKTGKLETLKLLNEKSSNLQEKIHSREIECQNGGIGRLGK